MSRLADYFVVIGYSHEKDRSGVGCGKILQRFPEKDWDDCPFISGLPLFCQPMGWALSHQQQHPSFYVAVLTDMDGERHYCAVFTFFEIVAMTHNKPDDEEDEHDRSVVHHTTVFAPKSLVLVSRHDYFEAFKNCLGTIYTVYVDNQAVKIETLIGNILGCVHVPPAGGPQVRFSISGADRQTLQPPMSATLPISNTSVAILFKQLGINNTLTVFSAALTDHKILFYSESCSRLCEASRAIAALHYPLKYTYVFIPVLPASLLEVLNSPTPFIAGVHASLKDDIADLLDVIIVDLDGGSVCIPECVTIPSITDGVLARVKQALTMILDPDLLCADYAFSPIARNPSQLIHRDKELRAVFIRMFAELFSGYRSSLAVVRIHPTPFITFRKSHFLGHRGMVEDSFLSRLLDGMAFNAFVSERGPPYRSCDIFDEVSASIQDQLQEEHHDPQRLIENIRELAHHLYANECPNQQPFVPIVPQPAEGSYIRDHQPQFPTLDSKLIQDMIGEGQSSSGVKRLASLRPQQMRIVPMDGLQHSWSKQRTWENNARRLEVLKSCVSFIFDNKISEARKIFPAVLRALKSGIARLALTHELGEHVRNNRAVLESQQFDLVVKLLNCALMNDSNLDENGVAAAILPLATTFCRILCQGVIQFAYTLIQEHAVWGNLQFWEQSFYHDVQLQIRQLYLPMYEEHMVLMSKSTDSSEGFTNNNTNDDDRSSTLKPKVIGPLEITAEQLRVWPGITGKQQQEMISNEESTVYSQAIHYAYRMVYLRVPLDALRPFRNIAQDENSTATTSVAESDSLDAESGFYETEQADVAAVVTKFVSRFVDNVCSDGGVTQEHLKSLQQMIPGVVAMHIETLEDVNKESKRLPPLQKSKIQQPLLLPGEEVVMEGLRAYLLADGREVGSRGTMGGPSLLPAEGAVFLTTYRIIFRGMPCDPFVCEQNVIRGFPVSSLTKEKKINVQHYLSQGFQEGLQLRSTVFQLMKIAFDEEVDSDNVETFRKLISKVRNPATVFTAFAFSGHTIPTSTQLIQKSKENISLKQFAKQKLLKTARKAGIKTHLRIKKQVSVNNPPSLRRSEGSQSPHSSDSESGHTGCVHYADLSGMCENQQIPSYASDPRNIERLMERHAYQDYQRLGLGSVAVTGQHGGHSEPFRVSKANANYLLSRSYPGLLVVPQLVSDESIRKFSKCNKQSRFPVITWRHPKTGALLLRASSFHSRSLMGMFRHSTTTSNSTSGDSSSALEQEKYFSLLVAATLSSNHSYGFHGLNNDSLTSLASLIKIGTAGDPVNNYSATENKRRGSQGYSFDKKLSSFIPSNVLHTKSNDQSVSRVGNLWDQRQQTSQDSAHEKLISNGFNNLNHVALFVFGEKAQMKGIKVESFPKCDFIPIDFHEVRQVKVSFRKLLRACVPSSPVTGPEDSFHRAVEDSEWLQQLSSILQLSGAVVDLMNVQGSSVMICLEDGWDITTQIVAVAEVLMDPYYRTIEGFRTLVEKEWLGFGHRFSHRNNQTAATQTSGFAPIFLQFLDLVHQIHHQFPLSFEFNQYFLRYLAYHCVSNRFCTFMLDSELERVESGWLLEEHSGTLNLDLKNVDHGHQPNVSSLLEHGQHGSSESKHQSPHGASLWEHLDKLCLQSPVFFNFAYAMEDQDPAAALNTSMNKILRPFSNVSNLKIWDFFITEDLSQGTLYDLDLVECDSLGDELEIDTVSVTRRRTLNACYRNIFLQQPNFFWSKIQEIRRLEVDLGMKPSPWRAVFDRLECLGRNQIHQHDSPNAQQVRIHSHSIQRKSTLEILVRGRIFGAVAHMFSQPHRFEKHTYTTSTYCDYCSQMLWGLSLTGLCCADCGYNCHDKCQSSVPKNCQKLKALGDIGLSVPHLQGNGSPASNSSPDTAPSSQFDHFKDKVSGQGTHDGYLYKQGQIFRQWKQRWFVLDQMKYQLRYYETRDDQNCKGFIDLSEVESVSQVKSVPGAVKKAGDHCFIEIRAVRRVFNFMAADSNSALEWVDKLQGCLQRES